MSDEYISGEEHHERHVASTHQSKKVTLSVTLLVQILVVVVLCGLSFYVARATKHSSLTNTQGFSTSLNGRGGQKGGFSQRRGAGGLGQVTAVSDTSITINEQRSGSSKTYTIDSSTTISDNGQTVAATDIKTGDTVVVMTSSSDSNAATRILVNPEMGGGFGGPSLNDSGSSTN